MRSSPFNNVSPEVESAVMRVVAGADEYHQVHLARLARTAELLYKKRPRGRLLEVGTSGFFPLVLAELCPELEVVATHLDIGLELETRITVGVGELSTDVDAYCLDLEYQKFPCDDEQFDYVLCCEVLEHMEVDPMYMLSEVNRVMKFGASLLLTTPNVLSSRGLTKVVQGIEPYFFMQYHRSREYHRHNYEYSLRSAAKLLAFAGFEVSAWTEDLFEDPLDGVVDRLREAGFDIKNVGDNIIADCKKTSTVVDRWPSGFYS